MKKTLLLLFVFVAGLRGHAAVVYVDADATGSNNGSSWANAYVSLSSALSVAGSGDTIWVAEGTYTPGSTSTSSFVIPSGVSVYGGFEGSETQLSERDPKAHPVVLSGDIGILNDPTDNVYKVVVFSGSGSTASLLDGVTIRDGYANGNVVTNQHIGGGIYFNVISFDVTVNNVIFYYNYAKVSGAFGFTPVSTPAHKVFFTNCIFANNSADDYELTYLAQSEQLFMANCIVVSGTTFNSNYLIRTNSANTSCILLNCTVMDPGLKVLARDNASSVFEVYNSVFTGTTNPFLNIANGSLSGNVVQGYTGGQTGVSNVNIKLVYGAVPTNPEDFRRYAAQARCSQTINAGTAYSSLNLTGYPSITTDVNGNPRNVNGVDAGAHEIHITSAQINQPLVFDADLIPDPCPAATLTLDVPSADGFGPNNSALWVVNWYYNNTSGLPVPPNWSPIGGGNQYTFSSYSPGDNGSYAVVVQDDCYSTSTPTPGLANGSEFFFSLFVDPNFPADQSFQPAYDIVSNELSLGLMTTTDSIQWYLNGNAIPGANSTTHTPSVSGNYSVVLYLGDCISNSLPLNITLTGRSTNLASAVQVYPNPASGLLNVALTQSGAAQLSLMAPTGQVVLQQSVFNSAVLNVEHLPAGLYLLQVRTAAVQQSQSVVLH